MPSNTLFEGDEDVPLNTYSEQHWLGQDENLGVESSLLWQVGIIQDL